MAVFSYLLGDAATRTCALVDPAFETGRILKWVARKGYRVTHVINTHGHSDHTSGNTDIVRATGASLLIHQADAWRLKKMLHKAFSRLLGGKASPAADRRLQHKDWIDIGQSRVQVLHTPGHTPGSICLYGQGHLVTGDTLFVGGVGRTDLPGGSHRQLIRSIRGRIYSLPGDTIVWPGHDYGPYPQSTVFREKNSNPFT